MVNQENEGESGMSLGVKVSYSGECYGGEEYDINRAY